MDNCLLTILFSRIARIWRPSVQQSSAFLDLPLDVMYTVLDELPLSSKILLSQTCRALWYQIHEKCFSALRQLTAEQRLETLAELGSLLPDQYLCVICNALHRIDYDDSPVDLFSANRLCSSWELWEHSDRIPFYNTAFHHVELATKYTHMNTSHQLYRERLLQKYKCSHSIYESLVAKVVAEPRVIRNRYILMTTCISSAGSKPNSFESVSQIPMNFCPHSGFGPVANSVRYLLGAAVQQAFHSLKGGCGARPKLSFLAISVQQIFRSLFRKTRLVSYAGLIWELENHHKTRVGKVTSRG